MAQLEHVNITVSDADRTAAWLGEVFGWSVRWQGSSMDGAGRTIHVGTDSRYIALYEPRDMGAKDHDTYRTPAGLNHVGVTVDNLDEMAEKVRAAGFTPGPHHDYEPGRRFYFDDADGIEWELVDYST